MAKSKIFALILLSFVTGVAAALFLPKFGGFYYFTGAVFLTVFGTVIFNFKQKYAIIFLCLAGFAAGVWRYNLSEPFIDQNHIAYHNGKKVAFVGKVVQEPDARSDKVKLTLEVEEITNEKIKNANGLVLVNAPLYPEYSYGDTLLVNCEIVKPEKIEDFSYDRYLSRYGIYSVCYRPKIELLAGPKKYSVMAGIFRIKKEFTSVINKILPEPQASFLGGLLLGAKKSIPAELAESFNRTGTTHIVAISGYNISIIAVIISSLCESLGISRAKSFWLVIAALIFFTLITGAQSSVVRAAIMGYLAVLARQLGRLSRITNALLLACVVMLAINPKVLALDAGFQLSFLATCGLVYLSPLLEKKFSRLPSSFQIKETFLATFSATVFTAPLIISQFGRFSLLALPVNLLILPTIPLAMGLGFAAGIFSIILAPLGQLFAWLCWLVLSYVIGVVEFFSNISFSSLAMPKVPLWALVPAYLFLILPIILALKRSEKFHYKRQ